jgi:steroid 5-alpha reductase family enzyme
VIAAPLWLALAVAVAMPVVMAGAWLIWRVTRNAGWVDAVWTFGLGAVGCAGALAAHVATTRQVAVAALLGVWSLRLGIHICMRTARITDDPRYAKLLNGWGAKASQQMFWLLQKQALVSIPLAVTVVLAAHNPAPALRAQDWLAIAVLVAGIAGESLSDAQLRAFRADPRNRGRICDAGLWRWSRHPNYFFECLGWIAYPLFAIDGGGAYPWGWAAIAGPVCMYWLLVHVSGIPPLEEHMLQRHGDAFRDYQSRTSVFFPMPPRAASAGT